MESSLTLFLEQISGYRLLTSDEERTYITQAQQGNTEARDIMIKHNLKLVVDISKSFMNRGVEIEDLIQEGTEGLMLAIEKFDLDTNFKFSTYSYYWIMQRVYKSVQSKSRNIRVPAYIHSLINKIIVAKDTLIEKELPPTIENITNFLNEDIEKVKVAYSHINWDLSWDFTLDDSVGIQDSFEQQTFVTPDKACLQNDFEKVRRNAIADALDTLSERAQEVLTLRYGLDEPDSLKGRTLKEVSEILGVSKERIRQIEKRALETLQAGGGRTDRRRRLREFVH